MGIGPLAGAFIFLVVIFTFIITVGVIVDKYLDKSREREGVKLKYYNW